MTHPPTLSALLVVHNEEDKVEACLQKLDFCDAIVVVLDKCTDGTKEIVLRYTDKIVEGSWDCEGERRNTGIDACKTDWVLEVDADEHVPQALAQEIRTVIQETPYDWHEILVTNYVGETPVLYGAGASFAKAAYPGLFKQGVKRWGNQRVHPSLEWSGKKGYMLKERLDHYVDRNISEMIVRLDKYSTARARDLQESGNIGSLANNIRRFFSRFFKCYIRRKGYKSGSYGFLFALFAGLFPLLSYFKAKEE